MKSPREQLQRRKFLESSASLGLLGLMAACGLLDSEALAAEGWNQAAFAAKSMDDLVRIFGGSAPERSDDVVLVGPEIAENGAVVPVEITSRLPATESIIILVEKNPNTLAANFAIPPGTLPEIQTRVKMAETCNIYALVKSQGKFYYAAKEVKVTVGGCGG
ncbi:MAG: thiosulfate oxidation carrier protein SoxY [Proteobacteria bacterium]|nr:MAG: thiosulfate oxidation carrier protein SoxY [Pseudomonadota bacterium]